MKQNELFNKCCENIDPKTREEVWKQMDKELGRTELEQAAVEWVNSLGDGTYGILDAFKAGAEWQKKQDELTVEDIAEIDDLLFDLRDWFDGKELYTEILKRFKEYKEQKNKRE